MKKSKVSLILALSVSFLFVLTNSYTVQADEVQVDKEYNALEELLAEQENHMLSRQYLVPGLKGIIDTDNQPSKCDGGAYVAIDQATFVELFDLVRNQQYDEVNSLMAVGYVALISDCTPVEALATGALSTQIRFLDEEYENKTAWTLYTTVVEYDVSDLPTRISWENKVANQANRILLLFIIIIGILLLLYPSALSDFYQKVKKRLTFKRY